MPVSSALSFERIQTMSLKKWKMREYSLRVKRRVSSGEEKEKLTRMLRIVRNRIKKANQSIQPDG